MPSSAQNNLALKQVNKRLSDSQASFLKLLQKSSDEISKSADLSRFVTLVTDSMREKIKNDNMLPLSQKVLAINCQSNLLDTLQAELRKKTNDYRLFKDSRDIFIPLLQSITKQKSFDDILRPILPTTVGLMAEVFKDYPLAGKIKDIAMLKNLEKSPENIMVFLSDHPNFALRDSLLFIYGNNLPEKLVTYVHESRNDEMVKAIRQHSSLLIQTLLLIAKEKNCNNYFPFVSELTTHKITLAEIDELRTLPAQYFKAIVDIEIDNRENLLAGNFPLFVVPTRKYVIDYAKVFFTDIINSLHEESNEKIRFAVLENLRPQDLYYIISSGEDELFTSSYLYTYKKLMNTYEKSSSDLLFDLVKYDQYRKFLLMAGRYNTLSGFFNQMTNDKSISILKRLLLRLEDKNDNSLGEIVSVAQTFTGIVINKSLRDLTFKEIKNNYKRCFDAGNKYGMKVYSLLADIFKVVDGNETGNMSVIPQPIAVYFKISHSTLVSKDGKINQLLLFFGDEDGKSSYASFLTNYSDASKWTIEKTPSWVKISSKKMQPISIYANLPLPDDGQDIKAQEDLAQYLKDQNIEPSILILRGHSYHLINSFKFFPSSIKLGVLGSCGGYTEIFEILKKSPTVQVISSKQIGSKQINEPLLKLLNNLLLNGEDLRWSEIWDQLENIFKPNKLLFDYFKEYIPPYRNIALLVTAMYNQ